MDGMDAGAVLDAPIEDIAVDDGVEEIEAGAEEIEGAEAESQTAPDTKEDPYTTKFAREMRAALKQWEQANPEAAKYAKQARDNHARLFALSQIEPKGIDGVRERYALLDSVVHGELKGSEAVSAMQEYMQETEQTDQLLAAGDPRALEALGPDFDPGLAKLAPAILDRVRASNPEAYSAAVLPHFVSALAESDLVKDFNALVDVLNTQNDPRFDEKTKMQFTLQSLGKMAAWFNQQSQKAGELKAVPAANPAKDELEQERNKFEQERQAAHWDTKIKPQAAQYENAKFEELFKPYQMRLKLDAGAKADLLQAFKGTLNRAGAADAEYVRQVKMYRAQKNPDPAAVTNFVKNAINKHSKTAMESLVKARYSSFLNGKPRTGTVAAKTGANQAPPAPGVEIRTVKPPMNEIDHRNTPVEWLPQRKYRLYSGKVVQVRSN